MITVFGATGRVGGQVVRKLLAAGERVRALGRSREKLAGLASLGAEALAGDAHDVGFLTEAFRGSHAVFIVMPHDVRSQDYHAAQDILGEAIDTGLANAGVRHVVFMSSIGADRFEGTGVVASLHRQERRLRELTNANVLMLRAGAFYENFYESLPVIKAHGIVSDAVAPDVWVPMIATRDIAEIASQALLRRDWSGVQVRELTGPSDMTYSTVARLIGERIGRPQLPYVQASYDEMAGALVEAGFTQSVAAEYVGLSRGINESRVVAREPHSARHVGTTSFESFAQELALAYRALPDA